MRERQQRRLEAGDRNDFEFRVITVVTNMDVKRAIDSICDYLNWDDDRVAAVAKSLHIPEFEHFEPTIHQWLVTLICITYSTSPIFSSFSFCLFWYLVLVLVALVPAIIIHDVISKHIDSAYTISVSIYLYTISVSAIRCISIAYTSYCYSWTRILFCRLCKTQWNFVVILCYSLLFSWCSWSIALVFSRIPPHPLGGEEL